MSHATAREHDRHECGDDRDHFQGAATLPAALDIRTTAGALICRSSIAVAARSSIRSRFVSSWLLAMSVRRTASR